MEKILKSKLVGLTFVGLLSLGALIAVSDSTNQSTTQQEVLPAATQQKGTEPQTNSNPITTPIKTIPSTNNQQSGLSNNNYYTNSTGNAVHSPAYSNTGGIPSGATARCGDGTYSFSQSRRGTCSHHGGVATWL